MMSIWANFHPGMRRIGGTSFADILGPNRLRG
jgi:hypothetical protein